MSLLTEVKDLFSTAIAPLCEGYRAEVTEATQKKFGHYQCNDAMKLTKTLRRNPRDIAQTIIESAEQDPRFAKMIDHLELAGPGFINIWLKPAFLEAELHRLESENFFPQVGQGKKVVVDYSSPNTAKEMHVGHLRSTIIGDCIANLCDALGYETLRLNHIGDWGTAFGMLITYMQEHLQPQDWQEASLGELVSWYRESKAEFDADPAFKKRAQLEVVKLQGGDEQALAHWQTICAISRKAYQEIYDLLHVKLTERGESFYNPYLPEVVADMEAKGLVTLSDGAKCIYLDGFQNREGEPLPLIIQKSDGGYNYATTDLAALRHRVNEEKASRVIVVTDAGQATHFQMFFEAARKAGYWTEGQVRLDHVPFGLVLGEDGKKFRTRSGEVERLADLLQRACEKAKQVLAEREGVESFSDQEREELAQAIGINSVKYADLSCNRISDYKFSYDRMLRFEGNTAPFLMYAYVRIQGIKRKAVDSVQQATTEAKLNIQEEAELDLALQLARFPDALLTLHDDLCPNRLCEYLYELAETFNQFFRDCRVIGVEQQESRLHLCEVTAQVLRNGMEILGLRVVERM